jgi:hypothetical protein
VGERGRKRGKDLCAGTVTPDPTDSNDTCVGIESTHKRNIAHKDHVHASAGVGYVPRLYAAFHRPPQEIVCVGDGRGQA